MTSRRHTFSAASVFVIFLASTSPQMHAEEDNPAAPTMKFFFYDSGRIEWAVSAEPERMNAHLEVNPSSARLFGSLTDSVNQEIDVAQLRGQMTRWLDDERERFNEPGRSPVRFRKAEGIVAYLRAHEFSMDQLVRALLRLSGAGDVEISAVHLLDAQGNSSYYLKVSLPDEKMGLGQQGFNVVLTSPDVTYTSVVYALALALYEVQEIINYPEERGERPPTIEPLPPPVLDSFRDPQDN